MEAFETLCAVDPATGATLRKRTRKGHRFIVVAQEDADTPRRLIGFRDEAKAEAHCHELVRRFDYAAAYVVSACVCPA